MIKIAAVDDEGYILEMLGKYIRDYYQDHVEECLVVTFDSPEEFLRDDSKFDILFLDIGMEEMSGLDLAMQIRQVDKETIIIFETNYPDQQQFAISVHAFAYLIKPVTKKRVYELLNEVKQYQRAWLAVKEKVQLNTEGGFILLAVQDILYLEYENRKVTVVTKERSFTTRYTMKEIVQIFNKYAFAVSHKAFMVNLEWVERVKKFDIVLRDGRTVPVAQKRVVEFKKVLKEYIFDQMNIHSRS